MELSGDTRKYKHTLSIVASGPELKRGIILSRFTPVVFYSNIVFKKTRSFTTHVQVMQFVGFGLVNEPPSKLALSTAVQRNLPMHLRLLVNKCVLMAC